MLRLNEHLVIGVFEKRQLYWHVGLASAEPDALYSRSTLKGAIERIMRHFLLVAALCVAAVPAAADDLAPTNVGALKLNVPTAWRKTMNDHATRFAAPTGDAYFDVDVGAVQTPGGLAAGVCLNKLTASIGGNWTRLSIGSNPAAKKAKLETDSGNPRYVTETYIGCNGKTTWSTTFHMLGTKRDSFASLEERITKSIQFAR